MLIIAASARNQTVISRGCSVEDRDFCFILGGDSACISTCDTGKSEFFRLQNVKYNLNDFKSHTKTEKSLLNKFIHVLELYA